MGRPIDLGRMFANDAKTVYGLNRQAVRDEINVQGYVLQGCAKKWASGWENFLGKLRQKW